MGCRANGGRRWLKIGAVDRCSKKSGNTAGGGGTMESWTLNAISAAVDGGYAKIIPISHGTAQAMLLKRVTAAVPVLHARRAIPATASIRRKCRKGTNRFRTRVRTN